MLNLILFKFDVPGKQNLILLYIIESELPRET
jgi:hypothetical protein